MWGSVGLACCWEGSVCTRLGCTELLAGGPCGRSLGRAARPRGQRQGCARCLHSSGGFSRNQRNLEGPAARPPARRPLACLPRPQDSVPGALCCGSCSSCPTSPRTPWPLVLQGRQACRLGRAAGALPRMCVSDCRGPGGRVKLDGLQGAPAGSIGCRPVSARPQAQGMLPSEL